MHVNLLPPPVHARIQGWALLRRWSLVWVAAGVCFAFYGCCRYQDICNVRTNLHTLQRQAQPLFEVQHKLVQEKQRLHKLQSESRLLESMQPVNRQLAVLGVISRAIKLDRQQLQLQRLSIQMTAVGTTTSRGTSAGSASTRSSSGNDQRDKRGGSSQRATVSLQGIADDEAALARLTLALRDAGVFQSVDLKSASHVPSGIGTVCQFQVECQYEDLP